MNKLLLFDVDGTLVDSSYKISEEHGVILNRLKENYDIGIVGGGKLDKILNQLNNKVFFKHYFTECGSCYNINNNNNELDLKNIYSKNIKEHPLYNHINNLIKLSLKYISEVNYTIVGHFIDIRGGLIYVSLIGMVANDEERKYFINIDKEQNIRQNLINLLNNECIKLNIHNDISICMGGSVGIAIYPTEYDKIQVLEHLNMYDIKNIYYFGDKYQKNGNDYKLINILEDNGYKIDNIEDTYNILLENFL